QSQREPRTEHQRSLFGLSSWHSRRRSCGSDRWFLLCSGCRYCDQDRTERVRSRLIHEHRGARRSGLAFQFPIGVLADRYDRRVVISVTLLAVSITWGLLAGIVASELPFFVLLAMALWFGGAMSSLYPLCVAETFDRL